MQESHMKWLCVVLVVAACAATEDEQRLSKHAVIQSIDVLARCVGVLRKADDDARRGLRLQLYIASGVLT